VTRNTAAGPSAAGLWDAAQAVTLRDKLCNERQSESTCCGMLAVPFR